MKYLYILLLTSIVGYSQSNEAIINQAVQKAKSLNIDTKSEAINALKSRGISESQARKIAAQRGLSYDNLLNEYFSEDNNKSIEDMSTPDNSILTIDENEIKNEIIEELETDEIEYLTKGQFSNYFGYEIFKNNPYLNKEYLLGNIDEGYLISPGDEIRIIIYGNNSLEVKVTVDRNGNINIRDYGLFFAAGMSFKTLKERLKIFLGKYLSGLVSSPQKTFMDVALTQLKPTKVVVLGQVNSPGPHLLTTSSSALSALYAAGGVRFSGSLREIVIYRNNKEYKKIDLYEYITSGKLQGDVTLTNNDVIFVPNRKNSIELTGELRRSSIYEMLESENLSDLINYSGGLLPTTQTNKVNIQRIIPQNERIKSNVIDRKLITVNYQEYIDNEKDLNLIDGDQVIFFRILDLEIDQVSIQGNVFDPGTFSLSTFPTLKAIINDAAKGVKPYTYFEKVEVLSIINGTEVVNNYNLSDILDDKVTVKLQESDLVTVFNKSQVEGEKRVTLSGFLNPNEDIILNWKENLSIHDIIFNNSEIANPEFKNNILQTRIDLKRYNTESGDYFTINYDFLNPDKLKDIYVLPKDKIYIYNNNISERNQKEVSIYGSIKNGKTLILEENMYPEDVILLAGGFVDGSDMEKIFIYRENFDVDSDRLSTKYEIEVDLDYLLGLKNSPKHEFILNDKDIISVKQKIGFQKQETISIYGEVFIPQNVVLEFKDNNLKDLIEKCGGLTKYANLKSSYIKRGDKILSMDLSKPKNLKSTALIDGDQVYINTERGAIISTGGFVEKSSNFKWIKGKRAKHYIKLSGGKTKDGSKAYVINSNGSSKKLGLFKNPKVFPGSIVVVNEKIKKEVNRGEFINNFNTTFGIITSSLTAILLANKL
tara:strand:+ start:635 stop:3274 length:2640 start_codon:yes stop_codon:yes gene_type:complete